jgi:hypothetical protein
MKFRKKPLIIEARMWTGQNLEEMHAFMDEQRISWNPALHTISIITLEGTMDASVGDWIIRGVKGEFYPCKPDIFDATYEAVVG